MHTLNSLTNDLAHMNLAHDDTVLIHSSMRAIGEVEGRADTVLDALTAYFSDGLLVFPTLTYNLSHLPNPVYDVRNTPCVVGILPELFRQRPGARRGLHPTHSLCAMGRDADAFVADDRFTHTPCAPNSSWHKLYERHAKILMVGCALTSFTFLHAIEEWCHNDWHLGTPIHFHVIDETGAEYETDSRPHAGSPSEQYYRAEPYLRAGGAITDGRLGNAPVLIVDACKAFDIMRGVLAQTPHMFDA